MNNKMPECSREDCRFIEHPGTTTLAYYTPIYDKNGININPDRNATTSRVECLACGKMWKATTNLGVTTYEELK